MQNFTLPGPAHLFSFAEKYNTARWSWCLLFVGIVALRHFSSGEAVPLGSKFGDTDDALRLVQVRDFLIHGSWYDTRLTAIGAPEALVSHWSRLIDLPIAWLISFFALFTSYLDAEVMAQIAWPLLLLVGLARFLFHEAEQRGGVDAGLIALALLLLTPLGLFQFLPGRIDHHNAQILCAVAALFLLQRAISRPAAGWWAGGLMALGLTIGFEALPLLAASLGLACLLACFDQAARAGACRAAIALAGGLVTSYALTTHPAAWSQVVCDALSPNIIALCGAGAAGALVLNTRFHDAAAWVWIVGFGIAGVTGIAAYIAADPTCVAGAFAGMDPIVKTEWLAGVVEGKTLLEFAAIRPSMAVGFLVAMGLSLAVLIRQTVQDPTGSNLFMVASTLLAGLYGFYYVKFLPYGSLLALVPIACWIAKLPPVGQTSALTVRVAAVLIASQTFAAMLAGLAIGLFSDLEADAKSKLASNVERCTAKSDIAALSKLPRGLVISDIDLGPFIAVATWHRAYTGPYHRIHGSIRDLLVLQSAPLATARGHLAAMNADYLVLCGRTVDTAGKSTPVETFADHLRRGGRFEGLEPVAIGRTAGPLRVWKINLHK